MDWNMGFQTFVKASPQDPPVMEVQVKVPSQIKKQFVWSKLGKLGLNMFGDLGLQKDVMEKTKMVVRGIKRLNERVEAAVKTAKWLLFNNTERGDMINTKGVAKALLQYRHTPVLGIWNSPEQMLLGRTLKDTLPTSPQKL